MSLAYSEGSARRSNVLSAGSRSGDHDEVRRLWTVEHWSLGQIAKHFGKTRNAAAGIVSRLGLKGKGGSQARQADPNRKRIYNNERRRERHAERVAAGRLEFASRLAPDDLPEVPKDDPSLRIPFADIGNKQCHWPVIDSENPVLYCGQPVASSSNQYCVFHLMLKYRPGARSQ